MRAEERDSRCPEAITGYAPDIMEVKIGKVLRNIQGSSKRVRVPAKLNSHIAKGTG